MRFKLFPFVMLAACQSVDAVDMNQVEQGADVASGCDYNQVFGNATHTGRACSRGPVGMTVAQRLLQDPDAQAESDQFGFYALHPSSPLTSGNFLIYGAKAGFVSVDDRSPETYHVQAMQWSPSVTAPNAQLVPAWTAKTSWKPVDALLSIGGWTNGYVQQFQPIVVNQSVYIPEASGKIARRNLTTGAMIALIDPLAGTEFSGDPRVTTAGAPSSDSAGNVYITLTAWPLENNNSALPRQSWLVKVTGNTAVAVPWTAIATTNVGVPGGSDLCEWPFGTGGTPPATSSKSEPPLFKCGPQRPALNSPVAIRDNGNLVAFSYANNAQGSAWLIEIDGHDLHPIRASATTGHMLHGCGGPSGRLSVTSNACKVITDNGTTHLGFQPQFNRPMRMQGEDLDDNAPSIAPDGSVTIGGYTGGFTFGGNLDARGGLISFDRAGNFLAVNDEFGWEVTPTVRQHADGTWGYLQDRQRYSELVLGVGEYSPTWSLLSFGAPPVDENAIAIDFLDSGIALDTDGGHYGVNGNGHLYKFSATGGLLDAVELTNEDGTVRSMEGLSSYYARDAAGRVYVSYAGYVYVISGTGVQTAMTAERQAIVTAPTTAQIVGYHAKTERAASYPAPTPIEYPTLSLSQPTPGKPLDPGFCQENDTECGGAGPGGSSDTPESAIEQQAWGIGADSVEMPGCLAKSGSDGEYQCTANFDIPFAGRYGFVCIVKCTRNTDTWKETCEVKSCEPPVQGGVRE